MAFIKYDFSYEERKEALKEMTWRQKVDECEESFQYLAYRLSTSEYFAFKVLNLCRKIADKKVGTLGVGVGKGGHINMFYNPDFYLLLSLEERLFVVNHEVLHCTLHHITLGLPPDAAQAKLFNYAHDLAINSMLKDMERCKVPVHEEDLIVKGKVVAKKGDPTALLPAEDPFKFDNYLTGQNYLYLLKKKFPPKPQPDSDCPEHGDEAQKEKEESKPSSSEEGEEEKEGEGSEGGTSPDKGEEESDEEGKGSEEGDSEGDGEGDSDGEGEGSEGGHSHGGSKPCTCGSKEGLPYNHLGDHSAWGESSETESNYADMQIQKAIEEATREKGDLAWGNLPGGAISAIKAAQETEVPWEKHLRHEIGKNLSIQRQRTMTKPNRRGVPYHTYQGSKRKYVDKILVAVDTSASVSDEELARFLAEINKLVTKGYPVDIMLFDCGLQFEKAKPFTKKTEEYEFEGRGGTEFSAPIGYAEEHKYKTLVMFTDGGACDPGEPDNLDILWVITPPPGNMEPPEWGRDRYVQMTIPANQGAPE